MSRSRNAFRILRSRSPPSRPPPRRRPRCASASRRRAPSSSCRSTSGSKPASSRSTASTWNRSDFGGGPRVQQALTAGALDLAHRLGTGTGAGRQGHARDRYRRDRRRALCGRARGAQRRARRRSRTSRARRSASRSKAVLTYWLGAGALAPAGLGHRWLRASRRSAPPPRRPPRSRPSRSTA